ncbi:MAG: MOSC domain-containing protein [Phycisphaerales bacterium]
MISGAHIVSVNVGEPRAFEWKGRIVRTSIFKTPVQGRVAIRDGYLVGDRPADVRHHGGEHKALYSYDKVHAAFWQEQCPGVDLAPGAFGENLTTHGLDEREVWIGDRFRVGSALIEASEPRMPCWKLALRWKREDVVQRFLDSRRCGVYWRIIEPGEVEAGDVFRMLDRRGNGLSVRDVVDVYVEPLKHREQLERALACASLSAAWRARLRERAESSGT